MVRGWFDPHEPRTHLHWRLYEIRSLASGSKSAFLVDAT